MRLWLVFLGLLPILLVGSGPGAVASTPALPQHNGLIAAYGGDGLYLVNPTAGSVAEVPGTAEAIDAAWSPDGTRLAVSLWTAEDELPGVYTMKPDGSERTLVVRNGTSPTWSPDGKSLAVVRQPYLESPRTQLVVVGSDGADERVLLPKAGTTASYFSTPAWSPDGKLIAFVGDGGRIGLVTPDGEKGGAFDVDPSETNLSWSPDSSRLAFDSYRESKSEVRQVVVVLDLASGKETVLAGEQDGAQAPEWSPEGDQIAFLSIKDQPAPATTSTTTHSCGGEPSALHLWSMRPDGTKAHELTEAQFYGRLSWGRSAEALPAPAPIANEQQPAPAPVAEPEPAPTEDAPPAAPEVTPGPSVTSEPAPAPAPVAESTEPPVAAKGAIAVRGSNAIYLVDPDSAAAHKVPDTADMIAPAWSPDGTLLAVERVDEAGASSVYTVRPDGTQPQLVLKNASAPYWSPAGDRVFVVRNECSTPCEPEDDDANVRYSLRPDGSDLQRVDLEQADLYDARELAWRGDGSPIWFFEDGSENAPGTFDTSAAAWSPDETRIAFIGALGPTDDEASDAITAGLWIASAEGGAPKLLLEGASGWPSWPAP